VNCLLTQKDVLLTRLACKAPADKMLLIKHVQTALGDVKALKNKDPKFSLHVQTVADGFGMFSWSAQPMLDEEWQEETINTINFYGFKVLQLKQDPDTAWQKAYIALARAFIDFVINNKDEIGDWKGQGDAAAFFAEQLGKSEKAFRGGAPAAEGNLKAQAQNLFAEIQEKALAMGNQFKHVEKNAHKKPGALVPSTGEGLPKKPAPGAPATKPAEPAKKEPKKELKSNTWYIENYGKEVIKFEGEEDVQPNYGFALIKCNETTIGISGKVKTIMLENCHKVKMIIDSVLTNIEMINC
jgi:adenylyl cyclase-associated protein